MLNARFFVLTFGTHIDSLVSSPVGIGLILHDVWVIVLHLIGTPPPHILLGPRLA